MCFFFFFFVIFGWFVRWEVSDHTAAGFVQNHVAFMYSFHLVFFFMGIVSVQQVLPYSSTDIATTWMKWNPLSSDFYVIDNESIARCMLTSFLVDEMLLPKCVNWSTNFRGIPLKLEIAPFSLKQMNYVDFIASCCLLQTKQLGIICIVCLSHNFCGISSASSLIYIYIVGFGLVGE